MAKVSLHILFGETSFWDSLPKTPRGGRLGKCLAIAGKVYREYKTPPEVQVSLDEARTELGKIPGALKSILEVADTELKEGLIAAMESPSELSVIATRLTAKLAATEASARSDASDSTNLWSANIQVLEDSRVSATIAALDEALRAAGLVQTVSIKRKRGKAKVYHLTEGSGVLYTGQKSGGESAYLNGKYVHTDPKGQTMTRKIEFASPTAFGRFSYTLHKAVAGGMNPGDAYSHTLQVRNEAAWCRPSKNGVNSVRNVD